MSQYLVKPCPNLQMNYELEKGLTLLSMMSGCSYNVIHILLHVLNMSIKPEM